MTESEQIEMLVAAVALLTRKADEQELRSNFLLRVLLAHNLVEPVDGQQAGPVLVQ
jgi:hypothetical protein